MAPFSTVTLMLMAMLLLSTAGNAWQFHIHDRDVAEASKSQQVSVDTAAVAKTCSDSIDEAAKQNAAQGAQISAQLTSIAPAIAKGQAASVRALTARPSDPNDLCKSLELYLKDAITNRRSAK